MRINNLDDQQFRSDEVKGPLQRIVEIGQKLNDALEAAEVSARPCGQHFEPFGDRVLVKQDAEAEAGKSLIQIPDSQKEPPLEGLVLKVGHGRWEHGSVVHCEAEEGDHVLFGNCAGTPIWIGGEEFLLLRDEEILGRVVR